MLTAEQNRLITETGPGTPCGALMRRYWQPAALVEELDTLRPVKRVRLLGEDLVLFRDDVGRYGLLHRHCAHRGADLAFARCEDGGLRCPFHGWLYDATGACLEQPAEPAGSTFHTEGAAAVVSLRRTQRHRLGLYGPGRTAAVSVVRLLRRAGHATRSPSRACGRATGCRRWRSASIPRMPATCIASSRTRTVIRRRLWPAVPRRDHRRRHPDDPADARSSQSAAWNSRKPTYGLRITTLRPINDAVTHLRITNMVFPHAFVIPMSREMSITQWHVPVDDTHCYWYAVFTSFAAPVDKATMRAQRLASCTLPDYAPRAGRHNDWGYDPEEQRTATYTGMGMDINVHDQWAVESMGAIQDRTQEHLGTSDRIIIAARRRFFRAIDDVAEGRDPPLTRGADAVRGPATIDAVGPAQDLERYWQAQEAARRRATPWLADDARRGPRTWKLNASQRRERFRRAARPVDPGAAGRGGGGRGADRETRRRALRFFRRAWRGARQDAGRGRGGARAAHRRDLHADHAAEGPVRPHRVSDLRNPAATAPATW